MLASGPRPRQPWIGIVGVFTRLELELRTQLRRDPEREALVGTLRTELGTGGLEPLDLTGAVGDHASGT